MRQTPAIYLASMILFMAGSAQAGTVSPKVQRMIEDAQTLAMNKDYEGAFAKLDEASAIRSTPDDTAAINRLNQYLGRPVAELRAQPQSESRP